MKWSDLRFWASKDHFNLKVALSTTSTTLPKIEDWYRAFDLTPFDQVKVVILGQDPYHRKGWAHGLAFSVQPHVKPLPPSLRTVLTEYARDTKSPYPKTGDLTLWAERGVLLLNTILTVEEGKALSHQGIGWEKLTYEVLSELSEKREGLVFMLWGKKAQEYTARIDATRHCVLTAPHPSPLSRQSFIGCSHFSKANDYLKGTKNGTVDWKLP